jgi:hypothetical protein
MCIFPNPKEPEGKIDRQWSRRQKQPASRRGICAPQRPKQRIGERRNRESGIQASAPGAHRELMACYEERSIRELVTCVAESGIDRLRQNAVTASEGYRRADDCGHEEQAKDGYE